MMPTRRPSVTAGGIRRSQAGLTPPRTPPTGIAPDAILSCKIRVSGEPIVGALLPMPDVRITRDDGAEGAAPTFDGF